MVGVSAVVKIVPLGGARTAHFLLNKENNTVHTEDDTSRYKTQPLKFQ